MSTNVSSVRHVWPGTGITSAPSAKNLPNFDVGVNSDGATGGNVYWVISGAWVDTGALVVNLFGG